MRKPKLPPLAGREPNSQEAQAMADAEARGGARPARPKLRAIVKTRRSGQAITKEISYDAPHDDRMGWRAALHDAFGTSSHDFMNENLLQLSKIARPVNGDADTRGVNAALAMLGGIAPQNELEGALASQMAAMHSLAMDTMGKAAATASADARERYINQTTKLSRTFTAQIEALQKLRTGGKQQVEVRYVYVDARTQTVVNPPLAPGGHGEADHFGGQPLAPGAARHALAAVLPLRGQDPAGDAVSVAGGQGAETMPDAWRQESRRAEGQSQRELSDGSLDG